MAEGIPKVTVENLVNNTLMRCLLESQIDASKIIEEIEIRKGYPYELAKEDSKGKLCHGSSFVPGGFIPNIILNGEKNIKRFSTEKTFRKLIFEAMTYEGANLLYPKKMIRHFTIPSDYWDMACLIMELAAVRDKSQRKVRDIRFPDYFKGDVTKSHVPQYIDSTDYGTRLVISACVAMTLIDPLRYIPLAKYFLKLNSKQKEELRQMIAVSQEPIVSKEGLVLAPPYVVDAKVTRSHKRNLAGPVLISGYGEFGEFATFCLEMLTKDLAGSKDIINPEDYIVSENHGKPVVAVLRRYPPTSFGSRLERDVQIDIVPYNLIGISKQDIERINYEAEKRNGLR